MLESYPFDGHTVTHTHKYGVDLKQNIFRWENWVALQRADAQVAQAEADYQAAQQDLISRVAQRYFDVLAAQDDLDAQEGALASVTRQLDQAEQRYAVGLIAITDVQEARASHDSSAAAVIAAKRQVASSQELLREITGDLFDSLARPVEPFELANPDPISEDRWVDMALQQNLVPGLQPARGGYRPGQREFRARRALPLPGSGRQRLQAQHRRHQHLHRRLALRQHAARSDPAHDRPTAHLPSVLGRHGVLAGAASRLPASRRQGEAGARSAPNRARCPRRISRRDIRNLPRQGVAARRRIQHHGAQRNRSRLRSRHAHRGGCGGVAPAVDPGARPTTRAAATTT